MRTFRDVQRRLIASRIRAAFVLVMLIAVCILAGFALGAAVVALLLVLGAFVTVVRMHEQRRIDPATLDAEIPASLRTTLRFPKPDPPK